MDNMKRYVAEIIGTFWLTFAGCGAALISSGLPEIGIGLLGVALAFGLTVMTMAYAVGHISGAHFNPAVTLGLWAGGRFPANQILPYIASQLIGAIAAAAVLLLIVTGALEFSTAGGYASTGYGEHSPGGYSAVAGFSVEIILTAFFVFVIMGATHGKAPAGFAPIAIGLCLTLMIMVAGPVTNASFNPARSTGTAVIAGGWALEQLWMFWVAPILGGLAGGAIYRWLSSEPAGIVEGKGA